MATTPIDLKGLNTGSAVSAPGMLSSTNLSSGSPLLPSSNLADLGGFGGSLDNPAFSGAPFDLTGISNVPSLSSSGIDLSALNNPVDVGTLDPGTPNANLPSDTSTGLPTGTPPETATGNQGLLSSLGSLIPSASTLAGLAPTAAVGAIGLSQAKSAQQQNQALAAKLAALGGPYTAAGQQLLAQWQSGQITPAQQNVVGTLNKQGQTLMDSAAPLSAIAQTAYQNYQSGTLPPADEQRLNDQVAAQKQQVAQQLASAGITDSTILAGQNAQIDNQAKITRQQLLDARFATGNVAYDQWLSATTQGQALQAEASKFAASSLDNMLTQSLNLSAEGMQPIEQSIQLEIQSNATLSAQVNQLMGNLAAAYAYQVTGGQPPGGSAAGGGAGGISGGVAGLVKGLSGGTSAAGAAAGALKGLPGGVAGPSADSITASDNAGLDFGNTATQQGAIDATAPTLDPNTISGLQSTLDASTTDLNSNLGDTSATDTGPPSSAGGEAATPSSSGRGIDLNSLGTAAGFAGGALGVYSGLTSGKPVGEAKAAVGATQLAAKARLVSPQVNTIAGDLGNVLGIYSGIKQGGVAGNTGAAVNAAQLGSKLGAFGSASPAIGAAAAYVAAPLALYNEISTWKSGATASDALAGAETGAAVGSIIPGIGTAIGAVVGGIAGAISSLFGSTDKTARSWTEYSYGQNRAETASNPAELMSTIGGLMRSPDTKFSGDTYFKGDGNKFTTGIAGEVASAIKSGKVPASATPQQIFTQVVQPWLEGLPGGWLQSNPSDPNRARVANAEQNLVLDVINNYQQGKPITYGETVGQKAEYSYTPYSQLKTGT
jgi:hypothetical protein